MAYEILIAPLIAPPTTTVYKRASDYSPPEFWIRHSL
jgi:hypothetical protein